MDQPAGIGQRAVWHLFLVLRSSQPKPASSCLKFASSCLRLLAFNYELSRVLEHPAPRGATGSTPTPRISRAATVGRRQRARFELAGAYEGSTETSETSTALIADWPARSATTSARPLSMSVLGAPASATAALTQPFLGRSLNGGDLVVAGLLGEAEDPLADDVALDLVGAAVDRRGLGEQRHLGDHRAGTGCRWPRRAPCGRRAS